MNLRTDIQQSTKVRHISIQDIRSDLVDEVVHVHLSAFQGYINTMLGPVYIKKFIRWFVCSQGAVALCAIEDQNKVVGYVVGAPLGYAAELNRDIFLAALLGIVTHFRLLLRPDFFKILAGRLWPHPESLHQAPNLPDPAMSLVSIGVTPEMRGKKVGHLLMASFEAKAVEYGMRAMRLSVYPQNEAARKLYQIMGWQHFPESRNVSGAIYYYKLLP